MDLDLNAHANARRWHGDRKARSAKQAKTLDAASRTLHIAEKTAQSQLSKARARMHDATLPYHLPPILRDKVVAAWSESTSGDTPESRTGCQMGRMHGTGYCGYGGPLEHHRVSARSVAHCRPLTQPGDC